MVVLLAACTDAPPGITKNGGNGEVMPTSPSNTVPADTPEIPATDSQETTPTATPLPAYAYALQSARWPETGALLSDVDEGVAIAGTIEKLMPGDYLLLMDSDTGEVSTFSLSTEEADTLLRPPAAEYFGAQLVGQDGRGTLVLEVFPRSWLFYDLADARSWGVGETCSGVPPHRLSPGGQQLAGICEDFIQMPEGPLDHVVMEVLSALDGTGVRIVIPRSPSQPDRPFLAWLDERTVLVSRVWIDGEFRACAVSVELSTMYCPPLGISDMTTRTDYRIAQSEMIPFVGFGVGSTIVIVPRECFDLAGACKGIQTLHSEMARVVVATSDPSITWWFEAQSPDPTTELGLVDLSTGEFHQIASLVGDYSRTAICPDGTCMFLFQHESETNLRLNLDGTLEVLPFEGDLVVGSFSVP